MSVETGGLDGSQSVRKPDRNLAVNFLGSALRENPQLLDRLGPRASYVLLAHSDMVNKRDYDDLASIFGIHASTIFKIFHREMERVWNQASEEIKTRYPITVVFQAVQRPSDEQRARMSKGQIRRYQDPEQRRINQETQRRIAQTPEQKTHYERIGQINKTRVVTSEQRARMSKGQIRRYQKDPRQREIRREEMKRRFEDPEERRKQSKRATERRHTPETRTKIGITQRRNRIMTTLDEDQRKRFQEIDEYDLELWFFFQKNQLELPVLNSGIVNARELAALRKYFQGDPTRYNMDRLLDKFSIAIARLG